jgi:hypothetical protein
MDSESALECKQNAENYFGFCKHFSEQYHKNGDTFFNHFVQVTGDKTWVSFMNAETNKHCLPTKKLLETVFWEKEKSVDGGIHA